jgi:predicted acetyltransferase
MKKHYLFRSGHYSFTVCAAPNERAAREFVKRVYPSMTTQFVGEDTRSAKEHWDSCSTGIVYKAEGQS